MKDLEYISYNPGRQKTMREAEIGGSREYDDRGTTPHGHSLGEPSGGGIHGLSRSGATYYGDVRVPPYVQHLGKPEMKFGGGDDFPQDRPQEDLDSPTIPTGPVGRHAVDSPPVPVEARVPAVSSEELTNTGENTVNFDVRDQLREQGVPESVLGLLDDRGVVTSFGTHVDQISRAAALAGDPKAKISALHDAVEGVDYYSDHMEGVVRERLEQDGLSGDDLDNKANEVLDVLADLPVTEELDGAVEGVVRYGQEKGSSIMQLTGALRDGSESLNRILGSRVAETSEDAAAPDIDMGEVEVHSTEATTEAARGVEKPGPRKTHVFQERTGEGYALGGYTPLEVQQLIDRAALEESIIEATGAPDDPEAYRRRADQVSDHLQGRVREIDPILAGDPATGEVPIFTPRIEPPSLERRGESLDRREEQDRIATSETDQLDVVRRDEEQREQ